MNEPCSVCRVSCRVDGSFVVFDDERTVFRLYICMICMLSVCVCVLCIYDVFVVVK